ncbi:MAG: translation initiation factor IF-3 [Micrococcaceae bacterium]
MRVPEVRLVGPAGEQVGIVKVEDAQRLAIEADLDLVEVAPNAKPPVCKLMDYGKYKYEAAVKAREARKNQAHTALKEIRFGLKIEENDFNTKKGHIIRFLSGGDKVKAMIRFKGREQSRPEMGIKLMDRLAEDVSEYGTVETKPRVEGRNMSMVLNPLRSKAEVKGENRRNAQREKDRMAQEAKKKMEQSLGDSMPEELVKMAQKGETPRAEKAEEKKTTIPKPPKKNTTPKTSVDSKKSAAKKPTAPKPGARNAAEVADKNTTTNK